MTNVRSLGTPATPPSSVALRRPHPCRPRAVNKGSVLLEVDSSGGPMWIMLVGKNFNSEGDWWKMEPTDIKNEKKRIITCVSSVSGDVYHNGAEQTLCKSRPYGNKELPRVQFEVRAPPASRPAVFFRGWGPARGSGVGCVRRGRWHRSTWTRTTWR